MSKEELPASDEKPLCFVLMPFSPDLYYFFLYLQLYIETNFPIRCERGDDTVTPESISEKIENKVKKAAVIIADCTGNNPNVIYELGIADAVKRPVMLIAREDDSERTKLPIDINNRQVVRYNFHDHKNFIDKLDSFLDDILKPSLVDQLYKLYIAFAKAYERYDPHRFRITKEELRDMLKADDKTSQGTPQYALLQLLLDPQNFKDIEDTELIAQIKRWAGGKAH